MSLKGLEMKALIVTDMNLYDVNDKFLEAGKYYFEIKHFNNNNNVVGTIKNTNDINTQYEFRFFSFMTMIVKAQSYLSRRLDNDKLSSTIKDNFNHLPNYPSPKKQCKKRISNFNKMNKKTMCMICMNESDEYIYKFNKIKCGHNFHYNCLNEWKNHSSKCPICRKELSD